MPVNLEDRPIEQVREQVIDTLIYNYSHGVISDKAFERRLDQAIQSQDHQLIFGLIEDLDTPSDQQYSAHKSNQFKVNYAAHPVDASTERIRNILGTTVRSGRWIVPKRIVSFSLLGDTELDFTDAVFSSPQVDIKIISILGSEKIFVPEEASVVCKMFSILGSVTNRTPSLSSQQGPIVNVEGVVIGSYLRILIKQTVKEKFMAFANQMKRMLDS